MMLSLFLRGEQQRASDALGKINIKVEFVRMKTSTKDGKGDRGEDKNQLYGKLSYSVLGAGDVSLGSGTFWDRSTSQKEDFVVDSWRGFSSNSTQLKIANNQRAETRLFIYGKVIEEDGMGGKDDVYFDKPGLLDGVETGFDALQAPGDTKEIPVTLSGSKGVIQILVRLTWG